MKTHSPDGGKAAAVLLVALIGWGAGAQDIHYVAHVGQAPASPYLSRDSAASNIQDAVDAAGDGDTVLVSNGLYNAGGRVDADGGSVTNRIVLTSPMMVRSVNGPAVTIELADASAAMQRWDTWSYNTGYGPNQTWTYSTCGGVAGFATNNFADWAWQAYRSEAFPECSHGQNNPLTYTAATNYYVGMTHIPITSGGHTSVTYRVGSQVYLQENCMRGGFAGIWSYVGGEVRFKVKNIVVSFY